MDSTLTSPGRLVSLRGREWVVLPPDDPDVLLLKPLGGSDEEITGIYQPLGFAEDEPKEAIFEKPTSKDLGAFSSARLLLESARLAFRNGAGPFRSLAKLSFRPRAYQIVPLIMALRHEPVRLTCCGGSPGMMNNTSFCSRPRRTVASRMNFSPSLD